MSHKSNQKILNFGNLLKSDFSRVFKSTSPLGRGVGGEGKNSKAFSLIRPLATFSLREKGMFFAGLVFVSCFMFHVSSAEAATNNFTANGGEWNTAGN
jgi:hypothetical protein